jgi:hypothetical protein
MCAGEYPSLTRRGLSQLAPRLYTCEADCAVRLATHGGAGWRGRDDNNFVYRLDLSSDGGKSWTEGQIELTFRPSKS